jgi:GNAT superfamily N-acetyltransferase
MKIRAALQDDAASIAALSAQLGYPASQEAMEKRLQGVLGDEGHAVFVVEAQDCEVLGWVHVSERPILLTGLQAAIGGLVVDQAYRRRGIGRRLMAEAEEWARARGCTEVKLRSNIEREAAHLFYQGIGYSHTKTQQAYVRDLQDGTGA